MSAFPEAVFGLHAADTSTIIHEVVPGQDAEAKPKYSIRFSVCGMSHDHIYGMVGTIPSRRAPLGIEVMKRGRDFLSDKPGVTTLAQLAEVRNAVAETKRINAIVYSERLEEKGAVKAGELVTPARSDE